MGRRSAVTARVPLRRQDGTVVDYRHVGADPAGSADTVDAALAGHEARTDNPHAVTKGQVGLNNVPNLDTTAAVGLVQVPQTTLLTGTQDNFSLIGRNTYLRCGNATALTFSGFTINGAAPQAGDRVIIDALASSVRVLHENAGSTAAHRARTPSGNGQIIGIFGRMLGIYDATTLRWRFTALDPGAPIAIPFDAAHFAGSGLMTWTVAPADAPVLHYTQQGREIKLFMLLTGTDVAGTPDLSLVYALTTATGFAPTFSQLYPVSGEDNGVRVDVNAFALTSGGGLLAFQRFDAAAWTASAGATRLDAYFTISVG